MSTTLIDWLYTDDPNGSSKQGALIMFPRMIDRWNVSSLIVSKWEGYKVVIITDHPNEFMETTTDIAGTKWTDLELIQFPLTSYSDLDVIRRYLKNTEIDIILFDDARMLATIVPALDFTIVQPKILVLSTWGDTSKQLDIVTSKLPELKLLSLDFINDTAAISWKVSRVPLSERQLRYYDQVRVNEIKDTNSKIQYPLSRMITLYAYPDKIMADTLVVKNICETDQTTYPDTLGLTNSWIGDPLWIPTSSVSRSWLSKAYIASLCNDGAKLSSVMDGIISHWPFKQVIITRFNHRYGVDLIKSFLQLMIQDKKSPYEMNEIFSVSCTDEYERAINTYHKFNGSASGVLVTNIVPLVPLKGVSVIHMSDSYSFLTLKAVLDKCHKRYLSKHQQKDLIVYSYIASHPREKSSDEALYETFAADVRNADRIYSGLIGASSHIVFNPKMGLMVK